MKVFKRVLIKLLLLLLVIGISGGGAACYQQVARARLTMQWIIILRC